MAIGISLLALLATFYQLYLQRRHNEKSLSPLPQIVLGDHGNHLFVQVYNKGLGPLIVERLIFTKDHVHYATIQDCLDLDPTSYLHSTSSEIITPVILPGSYLEVFKTTLSGTRDPLVQEMIRQQLALILLSVEGRDVYANKIGVKRDLQWFARHTLNESQPS